tara:strand:- start:74 stop:811 length:738 start_codon:yes stop_codon:yes gene_type:complete
MNILLTGSEGFIGKHLYKKLSKNHQITCIDKKIGYDVMTCHYPDKQDLVIHLAALSGVRKSLNNPTEYWTNNVISTQRLFKFYSTQNPVKILYASSSTAAEPWKNPYSMSKYAVELLAPENSLGMRFTTVYGPGARQDMFIPKLIRNEVEYVNCDHKRDFIHIEDVLSAIDVLMNSDEKGIVDVGTGETNYITDLLQDETVPKQIGPDTERKDNKADTEVLYKYGWKNKHNIIDYINSERSKRIN